MNITTNIGSTSFRDGYHPNRSQMSPEEERRLTAELDAKALLDRTEVPPVTGGAFRTMRDLLDTEFDEPPFLVENIIPGVGLSAIVGPPDCGKSQFTRQLAYSVVSGRSFLGMTVTAKHGRVIVVTTEESLGQVQRSVSRQTGALPDTPLEKIVVMAGTMLSPSEILDAVRAQVRETPVDLIILDSFGDLFTGSDPNSTSDMRKCLRPFAAIAQEMECAVLFVNHISKSAYGASPSQGQVINSSAFVQKCRSVLDLRFEQAAPLTKFLTIVKGNGVSSDLKRSSMVLHFDEETLLFSDTKARKPVHEINAGPEGGERGPSAAERATTTIMDLLREGPMPAAKLEDSVKEKANVGSDNFRKGRASLAERGLIESLRDGESGGYVWKIRA